MQSVRQTKGVVWFVNKFLRSTCQTSLLPKHGWKFGQADLRLHVFDPIPTKGLTVTDVVALREQVRHGVIDKIAEMMAYDEYVEAEVFVQLRTTPGERGGVFRDPDRASVLTQKLNDITDVAEKSCVVASKTQTANNESLP